MALLQQWKDKAYSETANKQELQELWSAYFVKEKDIYAQLLKDPDTAVKGTVKELADMPEFGVMFCLDADYDHVKWYGLGPQETYVDRTQGAKLGIYEQKTEDAMARYLVPQECGNKTGVRYAEVTDEKGRGLRFEGKEMNFSALPYSPHEVELAKHAYELPPVHHTWIRASLMQMGIAGDDSW